MSNEELLDELQSHGDGYYRDSDAEIYKIILTKLKEGEEAITKNKRWKEDVNTTEAALGISGLYARKDEQISNLENENRELKLDIQMYKDRLKEGEEAIKKLKLIHFSDCNDRNCGTCTVCKSKINYSTV